MDTALHLDTTRTVLQAIDCRGASRRIRFVLPDDDVVDEMREVSAAASEDSEVGASARRVGWPDGRTDGFVASDRWFDVSLVAIVASDSAACHIAWYLEASDTSASSCDSMTEWSRVLRGATSSRTAAFTVPHPSVTAQRSRHTTFYTTPIHERVSNPLRALLTSETPTTSYRQSDDPISENAKTSVMSAS